MKLVLQLSIASASKYIVKFGKLSNQIYHSCFDKDIPQSEGMNGSLLAYALLGLSLLILNNYPWTGRLFAIVVNLKVAQSLSWGIGPELSVHWLPVSTTVALLLSFAKSPSVSVLVSLLGSCIIVILFDNPAVLIIRLFQVLSQHLLLDASITSLCHVTSRSYRLYLITLVAASSLIWPACRISKSLMGKSISLLWHFGAIWILSEFLKTSSYPKETGSLLVIGMSTWIVHEASDVYILCAFGIILRLIDFQEYIETGSLSAQE
jgi:hypothetical protein